MLPLMTEHFANAGSITHSAGREVAELVDAAVSELAGQVGAVADEIVCTSGATESNNLALFGVMLHPRQRRRRIVSVTTEHKALIDPLKRLEKLGFEVVLLPVQRQNDNDETSVGQVDMDQLSDCVDDETALVSVMLANNEVGVIQPLNRIAEVCRKHGAFLHTDATQALGRIPIQVDELGVDLMSFSAHKFYGPKGVGGLFVRRRDRRVRLQSQIVGGGQQDNMRSGTLNTAGIVGMAAALNACCEHLDADQERIGQLRDRLWDGLQAEISDLSLNGPSLHGAKQKDAASPVRLRENLNCSFYPLEGQSLMLAAPEVAVSSGSACTSAEPSPSHVLLQLGLSEEQARSSLRFGIGRFTTADEIDHAVEQIARAHSQLSKLL